MKIKALLFDFDETLFINEESTAMAVSEAWKAVSSQYPDMPVEKVIQTYMATRDVFWQTDDPQLIPIIRQSMKEVRCHLWKGALGSLGIKENGILEPLVNKFTEVRYGTWRLYPDSLEVLDHLKEHYKMAIVTNGIPEVQRSKIKKVQVESYFYPILVSGELGISKPDPEFFNIAAKEMGINIKDCVVIGDSVRNDVGGAKNAGIPSIWMNRNGQLPRPSIQPDYEIKNMKELVKVLEGLG